MRTVLIILALTLGNSVYAGFLTEGAEAYKTVEEVNHLAGAMFVAMTLAVFKFLPSVLELVNPFFWLRKITAVFMGIICVFMIFLIVEQYEPYFVAGVNFIKSLWV